MDGPDPAPSPQTRREEPTPREEFERLIQRGHEILHVCGWDGTRYRGPRPSGVEVLRFRAQASGLIRRVCGEDSRPWKRLQESLEDRADRISVYLEVLEAVHEQYRRSQVFTAPDVLLADLDGSFIELAETLVNAGCPRQAAASARGHLERVVRGLSAGRGVGGAGADVPDLIDALHAAGILDEPTHRRTAASWRIVDDAPRPCGCALPDAEIADAVSWIRGFVLAHRLAVLDG